ncbi:LysM peptidoglycan-binding domain-containing protein [Marinicrinis lubricantis]|uniref:LysM peptidoglycan-binding domain-containing protein n=1 Tax=Marinicrinis lubricantis TaxID=2086470 RepID=A0ABW1ITQ4_9BACL
MKIHIVKSGEDISSICGKYQVSEESLLTKNPQLVEFLQPGMKIFIPTEQYSVTTTSTQSESELFRGSESEAEDLTNSMKSLRFEIMDEQYDESSDWSSIEAEEEETEESKDEEDNLEEDSNKEDASDNSSSEGDFTSLFPPSFYELPKFEDFDSNEHRPPQTDSVSYPGLEGGYGPFAPMTYPVQAPSPYPVQSPSMPQFQGPQSFFYQTPHPYGYVPAFPQMDPSATAPTPSPAEPLGWFNWNPDWPNVPENDMNEEEESGEEQDEEQTKENAAEEKSASDSKTAVKNKKGKAARTKKRKKTLRIKRNELDKPVKRKKSVPWINHG